MMGKAAKDEVDEASDYGITLDLVDPTKNQPRPMDAEVQVGQVLFGRYRIESRLGASGMGTVYRAEDKVRSEHAHMDGRVALKVVHAGPDMPASVLDKLRHEFYCAQGLSHPSIV